MGEAVAPRMDGHRWEVVNETCSWARGVSGKEEGGSAVLTILGAALGLAPS
jgi:hypothetical protein